MTVMVVAVVVVPKLPNHEEASLLNTNKRVKLCG